MMFSGVFTAVITPFHDDGKIDFKSFEKILEKQIECKIDGVVIAGTTGESPTLSKTEHLELIEFAVNFINKRIKVIAGTGSNSTYEAIKLTSKSAQFGADAALLVTPYYNKPTPNGLFQHFSEIAKSVPNLPQILYDVPGRTGTKIPPKVTADLAENFTNIIGIKDASGDINHSQEIFQKIRQKKLNKDFFVLSGNDDQTFLLKMLGGKGVISVASNAIPEKMRQFVDLLFLSEKNPEKLEKAKNMHFELLPIFQNCFIETNPIPIKTVLAAKKQILENFRLPLCKISPENRQKLLKTFEL